MQESQQAASLGGRTAVVTGGSKGIGKAIARAFALAGANVMLTARKLEGLEAARAELEVDLGGPGQVAVHAANAGDPDAPATVVADTIARFGSVDILVNNAATSPYTGALIDIDVPRWEKTMAVNLRGPLLWTQACWRAHMREHGGTVLNISSVGGRQYTGSRGNYAATKAGLDFLTRHLAVELAPRVRVNCIAPGLVRTEMATVLWATPEARIPPMGRLGEPADIAAMALFLVGDAASWITGQVVDVDGGALITDYQRYPRRPRPEGT